MSGLQSALALSLFSTVAGAGGQQAAQAREQTKLQRRSLLLERDRERRERLGRLRELQARSRARAASGGVAGGGSAEAILSGLEQRASEEERDAERALELRQQGLDQRERSNLLSLTEQRQRAVLGLGLEAARQFP